MRRRAAGTLPDMGCALRVAQIIKEHWTGLADRPPRVLDVGCATGHFRRTFDRFGLGVDRYVGLEIDPAMVHAGTEVWREEIAAGSVQFINDDLERFRSARAVRRRDLRKRVHVLRVCEEGAREFASCRARRSLVRAQLFLGRELSDHARADDP